MQKHKLKLFLLLMMFFVLPSLASAYNFSHIKIGTVNYQTEYLTQPLKDTVLSWQSRHNDFFEGGSSPKPFSLDNIWTVYETIIGFYATDTKYDELRLLAAQDGFEFENVFLHMKQDYRGNYPWSGMDKFDVFENYNGVITDDGGILSDKTAASYSATVADVSFQDNLYVGLGMPFAEMNFLISTFSSNLVGSWQYWNGVGWIDIPQITDNTNSFTQNEKINFTPPADWSRTVVNGSFSKYFVRYHLVSASIKPILSKIYGDNLLSSDPLGQTFNVRGWDANDANIINKGLGELEFNPTPPNVATAKFRWQARVTGYWQPNYLFINPAYIFNGKRVWGDYNANLTVSDMQSVGANGVMYDSLSGTLSTGVLIPTTNRESFTDFFDYTANTWTQETIAQYRYITNKIHSMMPEAKVGGNTGDAPYALEGDWTYIEYASSPAGGGALSILNNSATAVHYDNYLPINNPNSSIALFMQQDILDNRTSSNGAFWDRSDRGPMTALSSHYIAANDKTYFHYYSEGGWRYDETDEIFIYNQNTTNLSQDLSMDASANLKTIKGVDFAIFPVNDNGGRNRLRVGNNILSNFNKIDNQTITTTGAIDYGVASGQVIKFMIPSEKDRMSSHEFDNNYPRIENVYRWANYFPAMFFNIGQPDVAGHNAGLRDPIWQKGGNLQWLSSPSMQEDNILTSSIDLSADSIPLSQNWPSGTLVRLAGSNLPSGKSRIGGASLTININTDYYLINLGNGLFQLAESNYRAVTVPTPIDLEVAGVGTFNIFQPGSDVWRRDYEKAIIVNRPGTYNTSRTQYDSFSVPIDLGGVFYPLKADGTLDAATTTVSLRIGDGKILVKESAVAADIIAPRAPSGLSVM